jgi:hypothetical protein
MPRPDPDFDSDATSECEALPLLLACIVRAGSFKETRVGSKYARVFPDPVGAIHIVSLPSSRLPATAHCTPHRLWIFADSRALSSGWPDAEVSGEVECEVREWRFA